MINNSQNQKGIYGEKKSGFDMIIKLANKGYRFGTSA